MDIFLPITFLSKSPYIAGDSYSGGVGLTIEIDRLIFKGCFIEILFSEGKKKF